jgi:hypothetical protein
VALYETDDDRDRQAQAAWLIEAWAGVRVIETPTVAGSDFLIARGATLSAVGEYKHRKVQYDPYMVDKAKLEGLVDIAMKLAVPAMLFVQWGEGPVCWHRVDPNLRYPTGILSRNNPRDARDTDNCFKISINLFKPC